MVLVGALPAHLYLSEDAAGAGASWRRCDAAPSVAQWCFPPPPRIGHVKDIVIDGDRLLVGIEIGALLVSNDFGESFAELAVDPNPARMRHPPHPGARSAAHRIIIANGLVGVMTSEDRGATWQKNPMPRDANYPDAIVVHPDDPDLIFLTPGWAGRSTGISSGAGAERSSAAATPERAGSGCSAACPTASARCSAR